MANQSFTLHLTLTNQSGKPTPGLTLQVLDNKSQKIWAEGITDEQGHCLLSFDFLPGKSAKKVTPEVVLLISKGGEQLLRHNESSFTEKNREVRLRIKLQDTTEPAAANTGRTASRASASPGQYEPFRLAIVVKDKKTNATLPDQVVEAWFHHSDKADELLGKAETGGEGQCYITFQWNSNIKKSRNRPVYCKVLRGERVVYNSMDEGKSWWLVMNEVDILLQVPERQAGSGVPGLPLSTAHFNLLLNDLSGLPDEVRRYFDNKLNAALLSEVRRLLAEVDRRLETALLSLALDYKSLTAKTLAGVMAEIVLPALQKDCEVSKVLVERNVTALGHQGTVAELLHLEQAVSKNPIFREDVRAVKTYDIVAAAGLDDLTAGRLLKVSANLETTSAEQWKKWVEERVIEENEREVLQRSFQFARFSGGYGAIVKQLLQAFDTPKKMAELDAPDWLQLIQQAGGTTPSGETPEDYAGRLTTLAQRNFPTAFFLHRKVKKAGEGLPDVLSELNKLQTKSSKKSATSKDATPEGRILIEGSAVLKATANTYKFMNAGDLLSDPNLSPETKVEQLGMRQGYLQTFAENNPSLDLRSANFFKKTEKGNRLHHYNGIPEEWQGGVRHQMMAYQRVLRLAPDFISQETLLAAGYTASHDIVQASGQQLAQDLGTLDPAILASLGVSASNTYNMVAHSTAAAHEVAANNYIGLRVDNIQDDLKNHLADIDGYADLFGSQDYCECDHCKSIFSPSAYFVDLMSFIERNITEKSPGLSGHAISLPVRRPDLWNLELTCENTGKPIPYLQIINEIKEAYIKKAFGWSNVWKEFSKFQHKESFRLAFNQPFEEGKILMDFFKLTHRDVLRSFNWLGGYRWEMAYLGVSYEEWQVLTTSDTIFNDLRDLRFNFSTEAVVAKLSPNEFMRAAKITRDEMEDLLAGKSLATVGTVVLVRNLIDQEIQQYTEHITGLDKWQTLDFVHRFLRLRRWTGWTIPELDMVAMHVKNAGFGMLTMDSVAQIATVLEVQRVLKTTVEEAVALYRHIPREQPYTRQVVNPYTGGFIEEKKVGMLERMFDPAILDVASDIGGFDPAHDKMPYLLDRLGLSEEDFGLLYKRFFNSQPFTLNMDSASELFRIVFLAKAFGIGIEEMIMLHDLTGGNSLDAGRILQLAPGMEKVRILPLSLHESWFVLRNASTSKLGFLYKPDPLNAQAVADLETTAVTLTDAFNKDERLWVNAEEILQELLPVTLQAVAKHPFSNVFITNGLMSVLPDPDNRMRIIRTGVIAETNIPATFPLLPGETHVPLTSDVRQAIADRLNDFNSLLQETVFREHLASFMKTTEPMVAGMKNWLPSYHAAWTEAKSNLAVTDGNYTTVSLSALLPEMERANLLFSKLRFTENDLNFIEGNASDFGLAVTPLLSFLTELNQVQRFADYMKLKAKASTTIGEDALHELLTTYDANSATAFAAWISLKKADIAGLFGMDVGKAYNIVRSLDFNRLLHIPPVDAFMVFETALNTFGTMGIYAVADLKSFYSELTDSSTDTDTFPDYDNTYPKSEKSCKAMRAAVRTRFSDEEAFEKAFEPYENRINELRRDVLCAFLLSLKDNANFKDTGDLYAYFLVDVEMSGCSKVSRILAATLSCQIYLHRCLMGLEFSDAQVNPVRAFLSEDAKKQWVWRKNYRVWEANRKVFLYPENYIEPEWRDDKSPQFRTLEDELLQQKISLESAEGAYKQYLKGFGEVGNLVIAGVYYFNDPAMPIYHVFGRTPTDPYQYYYRQMRVLGRPKENYDNDSTNDRTWKSTKEWTPWEKVELSINSPMVSPHMEGRRLYIFWISIVTQEKTKFKNGNSEFQEFAHTITLNYSWLQENGKWIQPQTVKNFFKGAGDGGDGNADDNLNRNYALERLAEYENNVVRYRLYPKSVSGKIKIDYLRATSKYSYLRSFFIDTFHNTAHEDGQLDRTPGYRTDEKDKFIFYRNGVNKDLIKLGVTTTDYFEAPSGSDNIDFYLNNYEKGFFPISWVERWHYDKDANNVVEVIAPFPVKENGRELRFVFHRENDIVFRYDQQQYLLRTPVHRELLITPIGQTITLYAPTKRETIRLNTTVIEWLQLQFMLKRIDGFLTPGTQAINESSKDLNFSNPLELGVPFSTESNPVSLEFNGAHGLYFRELFFHIPFLIADHLNAEGKYKEADYWYRKIFDPTASPEPGLTNQKDRYWGFIHFRNRKPETLLDILTDAAAIQKYESDPFNPHAIARLRLSAYQKSVVMKYIDNALDWADSLFIRDTWESNIEALMLYILAKDLLGERPQKLGKCDSAVEDKNCGCQHPVTYTIIRDGNLSDFVYYVENWVATLTTANLEAADVLGFQNQTTDIGYEDLNVGAVLQEDAGTVIRSRGVSDSVPVETDAVAQNNFLASFSQQLYKRDGEKLVFCVPHNEKMMEYWDRVADRLFKLRNCMNIDGVRRSLALFQPPIDPALLVAARASGLSLEDILAGLGAPPPPYRFNYLVEKAKAFAGTVQGFGGALLSALEKKDTEELTLLRTMQDQNMLKLTKEVKKQAIEEAKANLQGSLEGFVNVVNRSEYYKKLFETDLIPAEIKQQKLRANATRKEETSSTLKLQASYLRLIVQLGAPTALTYGGEQIGNALNFVAEYISTEAAILNNMSNSSGVEASNQRRKEDWKFQKKLAEQELKQVHQQIASATIRLAITEKDLEIHEKQIEQAEELHDFYKNKFTGLGLYNHLATSLSRLHRMAYIAALDLANQAEAAYRFETDDFSFQNKLGNWDASRAGLLAGEQLSLNLQKMESAYLAGHRRTNEITQSISLRDIAPTEFLKLRQTGSCAFEAPEWIFDLYYPGYYKRILKSVRLTIPCVVGPYANVACRLSMNSSQVRKSASEIFAGIKPDPAGYAASTANNDGGQFELNFRDERYLPFEGAGAVSSWTLQLPSDPNPKMFDYNTISDVILHLSYTAKFESSIPSSFTPDKYQRLISVKDEFPDAWYLLQTGGTNPTVKIGEKHLPYFMQGNALDSISYLDASLVSKEIPNLTLDPKPVPITLDAGWKSADGDIWLLVKCKS